MTEYSEERGREALRLVEEMAQYLRSGRGPIDLEGWEEALLPFAKPPKKSTWPLNIGDVTFLGPNRDGVFMLKPNDLFEGRLRDAEGQAFGMSGATPKDMAIFFCALAEHLGIELEAIPRYHISNNDGGSRLAACQAAVRAALDLAVGRDAR